MPAPLLLAAALAQRTTRIRLGTAVLLLPLQYPLRTAEEAAVVDLLSHGRLELGVGRGMISIHFQGFNVPREESRARFEEALMLIKQAWTQETCSFDGKFFQVPPTAVVPSQTGKDSYYVCPAKGCWSYSVQVNDTNYSPQGSACPNAYGGNPDYSQPAPTLEGQLAVANVPVTRSQNAGVNGGFPNYVPTTEPSNCTTPK